MNHLAAVGLLIGLSLLAPPLRGAASDEPAEKAESHAPFLPTWKLLKPSEKQEFISGYLQGWRDAVQIVDVVISYIRENPDRAERAFESIKQIYEMSGLKPDQVAHEIDLYYSDPANRNAPLSRAITAAKGKLQ